MVFPETPIFDALAAEYEAGLGPASARHRWIDPPTVELPTAPIPIAKEDDVRGR